MVHSTTLWVIEKSREAVKQSSDLSAKEHTPRAMLQKIRQEVTRLRREVGAV